LYPIKSSLKRWLLLGLGTLFIIFGIVLTLISGRGMEIICMLATAVHVAVNIFFSIYFGTLIITRHSFLFLAVAVWNFRELRIDSVISFLLISKFVDFF
jgi:hypothetical protein